MFNGRDTIFASIGVFGTTLTAFANDVLSLLIGVCTLAIVAPKAYAVVTRKKTEQAKPASDES